MENQISMYDLKPEQFNPTWPKWIDCFKTCKHFGKVVDHFPASKKLRCDYGIAKCGTGGDDVISGFENGCWHTWCKFYEGKAK